MSADLTVPPPSMPGEEFDKVFGKHAGLNDHGEPYLRAYPDEFRDIGRDIEAARDAIWSERIAALLRAVPPLPVVALYSPSVSSPPYGEPLVRKADAEAALASLQPFADVGRAMVELTTTVRGQDEWPAIPGLWQRCMEERDEAQAKVASLQARLKAAERDAARGRYVVENGEWFRAEGRARIAVRVPDGSDLSCRAMRERALDAAIDASAQERPAAPVEPSEGGAG